MSFKLSSWGIRNPVPVAIMFIALTIAGVWAYLNLPVKQFPNVSRPVVVVTVTQNGAAPSEMETQITRPVEDAVNNVQGIDHISSTVVQGASTTQIDFKIGVDAQKSAEDVRTRIDGLRANLPRDIDPPIVSRVETDRQSLIVYAVSAPGMSETDLSWFIDNTVARDIQAVKGVGEVNRFGGLERQINVTLDPDRMAALGVTAPQINSALNSVTNDIPGGRADVGGREATIRVLGRAPSVEALRQLQLPLGGGRYAVLADVADVGEGSSEERGFARLNGGPVVAFEVEAAKGVSEVSAEKLVRQRVEQLGRKYPNVTFRKIFSVVDSTKRSYDATMHALIEGMLLAALVVFLFLRSVRATAIAAIAMPLSLIPTFAVMAMLNFSLNVVTLLSLTLVIGILVDDAIVEIENIEKRIERGQRPYPAAMEGADAIGLAVIACTMTIVVVFTPVSFMNTMVGQYFKEFGLTVAVAVLFSLLVARMLTPLLAAYFLVPRKHVEPVRELPTFYRKILEWALVHKWMAAAIGAVFIVTSFATVAIIPKGFMPPSDPGFFQLSIQGPPGSSVEDMRRTSQEVTNLLKSKPDVESVFVHVGGNEFTGAALNSGDVIVQLKAHRSMNTEAFKRAIREDLRGVPDARVTTLGGFGGTDVDITLAGQDGVALTRAQEALLRQMRSVHQISEPRPDPPPSSAELVVRPRTSDAARLGVTTEAIASVARTATLGEIDANAPKFNQGQRQIPIRVRLPVSARSNLNTIGNLRVPTASGGTTPLSSVADITFEGGPAQVVRFDRERRASVQADLNGAALGEALGSIMQLPIMKNLPPGIHKADQGDQEAFKELFSGMILALLSGVAMIYAVLVLLFRSFFKPAVILSALPTTIGGAFLALLVTRLELSMPSMIGLFMLMGIAAKNSILLVEFAIEDERAGQGRIEALMNACRERARPIVMTSFAMGAGMLPTAIGFSEGSSFRQPMAVAVIGGLVTSTILSLVLVPVVYEIFDQLENWLKPKLARLATPRDARDIQAERDQLFGRPPTQEPAE